MSCPGLNELRNLLDGDLPPDRLEPVNAHIESCPNCQESLERLTSVPTDVLHGSDDDTTVRADDPKILELLGQLREATPAGWAQVEGWADEAIQPIEQLGKYVQIEPLARGGSGVLLRAKEKGDGRSVAIKIWPRRFLGKTEHAERVRRESVALSRLQHPHIVSIFEVGTCGDGSAFITMELVEGDTLSALVRRGHAVPPVRAATIVRDVASALAAVHDAGLVHRDIKPSNILIERSTSRAKLVDFGLVLDETDDARLTQDGSIAGTPQYMSPEQIRDPHEVDARSDIYSLGIVLYELLTGSRPYRGVMRMVLFKVLHEDPQLPSKFDDTIPRDLETICLKAIAKEPHLRFAVAKEFEMELQRWLDRKRILTRRPSVTTKLARWSRRNPLQAALIGAVCTLVGLLAIGGPLASINIGRARDEAERQETEASLQRDIALQTLEKMVFEISERFDVGGYESGPAKNVLLQTAIAGLKQMADSPNPEFSVRRALAGAHARLAGLLYQTDAPKEDVEVQLAHANQLLADLEMNRPGDFQVLTTSSYVQWYEARLLLEEAAKLQEDDEEAAKLANVRAYELLRATTSTDEVRLKLQPEDENVLHDATVSYEMLAEVGMEFDLLVAESSALRAMELARLIGEDFMCPENHEVTGAMLAARVARMKDDFESAENFAKSALSHLREQIESFVSDEESDDEIYVDAGALQQVYELLASVASDAGHPEQAKRWLQEGIETLERVRITDIEWQSHEFLEDELRERLSEIETPSDS